MKIYGKLTLGLLSVLAMLVANWYFSPKEVEHVHYHAGFLVYIDDELQDYSNYKYMNFVACTEHDTKKSSQEEQIEKAHLHDSIGDVVHVHRKGAIWGDLFKNIKVQIPKDKELVGYINGERVEDIMQQPIAEYSSVVFVIGKSDIDHSKGVVTKEHIKEVEAKSELCGSN